MLSDVLASGRFVVTAELGPPVDPDAALVRSAARALAPVVDAANVTDNQAATVKLSPLACSAWMLEEGLEPIMQVTGRDRNLMALQSDLLAAWALGVRTVLGLTGDPMKISKYDGQATQVGDVDSNGLAKLITAMNAGTLAAGAALSQPTGFLVAGAANPLVDQLAKLEAKLEAGVGLFQTNIVYDVARFAAWWEPMVAAGVHERAPLLVGVTPPRSKRMLQYMHDRIPGVEVDDATFARIDGLEGDDAKAAGVEIAVDVINGVRELPGIAGVHIMAPGWETQAVPRVVEGAGLQRSVT
jgi:methylenetetrahydrofolate reductase (NADPH)